MIICQPEFIESVLDILFYPESTKGPTMIELEEKIFKTKVLRWLENAILTLDFANTVNASYMLFQQLQKHYIALTLQNLFTIDDVMTQFCLNCLKFSNLQSRYLRP